MTGLILLPTDRLPSPHPEAPPVIGQAVTTLLHVAAFGMLAVGLVMAVVAGLIAHRRGRQGRVLRSAPMIAVAGLMVAVVGGLGMVLVSVLG
ncbi:hypothetical protein [Cutibacterium modestum]|uniref:hypothetical protein n=1 Tax=Cutibacterium modestum TaxID=2559073 RepID=UPI0020A4A868|nr:hypothetical protein [Cutibacterium modestum]MCP2377912.1 hypothetical protein [Cutibacterium modestum 31N]